jgi:ubiquitin C-terminal hydrolase
MTEATELITFDDVINNSMTSGLMNSGSTCYVNTAIQCLGFCSHFLKLVLVGQHSKKTTPLMDELKEVYYQLWVNRNGIAPHKYLRSLNSVLHNMINVFEQNDITEFLMLYIDKLNTDLGVEVIVDNDDMNEIKRGIVHSFKDNKPFQKLMYDMELAWINTIKKECSPIMDMFYGQMVSQIVCGNCNHIHHNYEVYSTIALPLIKKKSDINSEDLLQAYFSREYINKENKEWTCDKCKASMKSAKCLKLWRHPMVLIVTLKRFDVNLKKSNVKVSMPTELDLSNYSLRDEQIKYRLCAIANHQGGMGSGHYNCICRHKNGKWIAIDDMLVRPAKEEETNYVINHGYVYFYERM